MLTYIINPHIPFKQVYWIRDNYYSRLRQVFFYKRDYLTRQPYKEIEFYGEFGAEMMFVVPFAYWHHLNGTLKKTTSTRGTAPLYFFSKNHIELDKPRDWLNNITTFDFPNMGHCNSFSYKKWAQVPFKKVYRNEIFVFNKPMLIIANKFNIEWQGNPVNFFSIEMLDQIISTYKKKYQVIYNRPKPSAIVEDESEILDLGDYQWLKEKHPDVILLNELQEKYHGKYSFNELQLRVYANCENFISVHGGTGTLASYFGGTNILYSKTGLEHIFNEFELIFPKLSDARIVHVKNDAELLDACHKHL